jgi:acetylornithine deacetylase/succinyl-diaminopimelate desuccinylase-like protein
MLRLMSVLLLLVALTACRPPDAGGAGTSGQGGEDGVRVRLELAGEPQLGEALVVVYLLDGREGVSGAQVSVTGDMTHAGMVPVVAGAVEVEPGLYRAEDFTFTMAGDWVITAEIRLPDGTRLMDELRVTVPRD